MTKEQTCQWFALCKEKAVQNVSHPILNQVPTCQKHVDWLKSIGEKV